MAKLLSEFVCQNCGAKSTGFLGHCPQCGQWGTFVETPVSGFEDKIVKTGEKVKLVRFDNLKAAPIKRIPTGTSEVDRVLGGGLVPAVVILIAGEPGIGKSTLLLQITQTSVNRNLKVIYVTGEESLEQIYLRAERISKKRPNPAKQNREVGSSNLFLAAETDIEKIINTLHSEKPDLVIIDSIQTVGWQSLSGTPGSVGQVRECARILAQTAKQQGFALILVGHVTKEGVIAGPKVLEHLVDVVLQFEGDTQHSFRILRSTKNRFGQIAEVGVFEMTDAGLAEVENPSKFFLTKINPDLTGSAIFSTMSGTRVILCEIQALVTPTTFSQARRVVNGLDYGRVAQLLAVIGKTFRLPVNNFDIFVNVAGGLQISETAADLPAALSILSVFFQKPVGKIAAAAEVGLLGELREIAQIERRKAEAAKFGFFKFAGPELENISKAGQIVFPTKR